MERNPEHKTLPVLPEPVGNIVIGNLVRHHDRPVDAPDQRIQLVVFVAQGIQSADQAAHAGARNDVHGDAQFFHILDDAQMGQAARTAAGQDETDRGAVFPDGIHPGPHLGEGEGINCRIRAGKDLGERGQGQGKGKEEGWNASVHCNDQSVWFRISKIRFFFVPSRKRTKNQNLYQP